jgi:hypothetical protein
MSTLSEFEEFLLKEYENIAKAHFEAQKQFAVFFRYYILFASVPVLILTTADKNNKVFTDNIFAYVLLFLAFVGFFFYLFVINVKHEAVLYSRTVNGIRYHFYQNAPSHAANVQVLPLDRTKPKYYNPFNPVLLIMIILNTLFTCLGLYYDGNKSVVIFIIIAVLIVALHIISNYIQSSLQEKKYP